MKRRGISQGLRILGMFALFLVSLILMGAVSSHINYGLSQNLDATRTSSQAKAVHDYMVGHYVNDSITFAFDNASYDLAAQGGRRADTDPGLWVPDSSSIAGNIDGENIPPEKKVRERLEALAKERLRKRYLPGHFSGRYGWIGIPGFQYDVKQPYVDRKRPDGSRVQAIDVSTTSDAPLTINFSTVKGRTVTFLPLTEPETRGNRFFYLYKISKTLAESEGFRSTIADTLRESDMYLVAKNQGDAGTCGSGNCGELSSRDVGLRSWGSASTDAENEQEDAVGGGNGPLADALEDYTENTFYPGFSSNNDGYGDLSFSVDTVVEYSVNGKKKVTVDDTNTADNAAEAGWRVSSCDQSCYNQKSCSSCGCENTCDKCPKTFCSTDPGFGGSYSRGGGWTETPWSLGDGETHSDPFTEVSASFPPPSTHRVSTVREMVEERFGTEHTGDPDTDPKPEPKCPAAGESYCSANDICCGSEGCPDSPCQESADNDVDQTTRRVWQFTQLESVVRVEVTVTDERYQMETSDGLKPLQFTFVYRQQQTADFDGNTLTVDYPAGKHDCADADYFARNC